jgi:hypothetical protein
VSKSDSSGSNVYLRASSGLIGSIVADSGATHTPGVSEKRGTTSTFYHGDIKNTVAQTSTTQTVVASQQYDAFGNPVSATGSWSGPPEENKADALITPIAPQVPLSEPLTAVGAGPDLARIAVKRRQLERLAEADPTDPNAPSWKEWADEQSPDACASPPRSTGDKTHDRRS